ncbi:YqaA family protein [Chitinibacteraceae bacterium HSL-7]
MITDSLGWLAGLFVSGLTSATLLPGNSEVVWLAYLAQHQSVWLALASVTVGNTLGSVITVWMGARMPQPKRAAPWLARFGPWSLLLAWAPIVGDALCVAAGWLRWRWQLVVPLLCVGKLLRYLVLWWGFHVVV